MNRAAFGRITTPSLPSESEKNIDVIRRKFTDAIMTLFKRDEDKEKRLRALDELFGRGTGKYSTTQYVGTKWRFIDKPDGTNNLYLEYTGDGGLTWVTKQTISP